jgi:hypothetical protein
VAKRSWQIIMPGYRPFRMLGEPMDSAEALTTARSIWPLAEVL